MSQWVQAARAVSLQSMLLCAIPFLIAGGALVDQHCAPWGQPLVSAVIWLAYALVLKIERPEARPALIACLIIATIGEVVLSLVWGLYDYRLHNIPLFVPPGHVLLFWFGMHTVARIPALVLDAVLPVSGVAAVVLAIISRDAFSIILWAFFLACWMWGAERRFYAWMFVIALGMEIFATRVGNWQWRASVPYLGLPTMNPPLAAGAFYCVLDVLVLAASSMCLRIFGAKPWLAFRARRVAEAPTRAQ